MQKMTWKPRVILLAFMMVMALPFIFGMILHHQQKILMNLWAENQGIKITEVVYERFWRQSTSEYLLYYPLSAIPTELHNFLGVATSNNAPQSSELELIARYQWEHGPWFGKIARGKLQWMLPTGVGNEPILLGTVDVAVQWNGAFEGQLNIPQLKLQTQDENQMLMLGGGKGAFKYRAKNSWDAQMTLNGMSYEEHQLPLYRLGVVTMDSRQSYQPFEAWLGTSHFALDELKVINPKNPWLLKGVSVETHSQLIGKGIDITWLAVIESLLFNQNRYGPIRLQASAEHIDPLAWKTLGQFAKTLRQNNSVVSGVQGLKILSDLIPQLLLQQPKLEVHDLNIQTPQGALHVQGVLGMKSGAQASGSNTTQLLQALQVMLDVTIAKPLLEDIVTNYFIEMLKQTHLDWSTEQVQASAHQSMKAQLQIWRDKEWIVGDAQQYQLNIRADNGVLQLNNHVLYQ